MKNLVFILILVLFACKGDIKISSPPPQGKKGDMIDMHPIQKIEVLSIRRPRNIKDLEKLGYRHQDVEEDNLVERGIIGTFQNNTDTAQYIFMSYDKKLFIPRTIRGFEENDTLFRFNYDGYYSEGEPKYLEKIKPHERKELYINCFMCDKRRPTRLGRDLSYCSNFEVFQFAFSPIPKIQYTNFVQGQFAFYTNSERRFQLFSPYGKDEWYSPEDIIRFGRKIAFDIDTIPCN